MKLLQSIKSRKGAIALVFSTLSAFSVVSAQAQSLTYDLSGQATGSLNGVAFSGVHFEVTGVSDASAANVTSNATALVFDPAQFTVAGVGTGTFSNTFGFTGLHHLLGTRKTLEAAVGGDLTDLLDFTSSVFGTWDYKSPLATTAVNLTYAPGSAFDTTQGALIFTDATHLELTVSAVPEPASLGLGLIGLCVVAVALRRAQAF